MFAPGLCKYRILASTTFALLFFAHREKHEFCIIYLATHQASHNMVLIVITRNVTDTGGERHDTWTF